MLKKHQKTIYLTRLKRHLSAGVDPELTYAAEKSKCTFDVATCIFLRYFDCFLPILDTCYLTSFPATAFLVIARLLFAAFLALLLDFFAD